MSQVLAWCLAGLVTPAFIAAPPQAPSRSAGVVATASAAPILAVARLLTEETWNPLLDQRIQQSPAAASLGAAWTPADPRWQKARATLAGRMTRILDAYATSGEVTTQIESALARIGDGPGMDAAAAALSGPAAGAVIRQQARSSFIVSAGTASPNGPAIGSPEWNAQLKSLGETFDRRIGSAVAPEDRSQIAAITAIFTGPAREVLMRSWSSAIANATRQLGTALNLMVFDNQAAIERDVTQAIGGR